MSTKYCLSWDSHKNNICNGFAQLQQREEFVDMTLVAEGHLVKVHKNLISLASPYIKNIIKAAPCEHPIIFLVNLTHDVLCLLLEYIYTGEVQVEYEKLDAFLKAAIELQLPGIDNQLSCTSSFANGPKNNTSETLTGGKKIQILENRLFDYGISDAIKKTNDNQILNANMVMSWNNNHVTETDNVNEFLKFPDSQNLTVTENCTFSETSQPSEELNNTEEEMQHEISLQIEPNESILEQYTVSNRGSYQMILNRYLYNMHYSACGGQKRRWRCVDYRLLHCMAYVDTVNDKITKRKNYHVHPFHDCKIMKKVKDKLIFGSLSTAIREANKRNGKNAGSENIIEND